MSGTTDTSTPAQRQAFCNAIESGAGGPVIPAAAVLVAQSPARLPETTAYLLDLPDGSTYAQAVSRLQMRWASGRAGF
jgi:hypothetical protein